jgi:transposase
VVCGAGKDDRAVSRRPPVEIGLEQKVRVVLAVLGGEMTLAEAGRRHGVSALTVARWRDRFLEAGQAGSENALPGPGGKAGSITSGG